MGDDIRGSAPIAIIANFTHPQIINITSDFEYFLVVSTYDSIAYSYCFGF